MRFGEYGGGGDGDKSVVALDEAMVWNVVVRQEMSAVHEESIGRFVQCIYGAVHGHDGCLEDVEFVDFEV